MIKGSKSDFYRKYFTYSEITSTYLLHILLLDNILNLSTQVPLIIDYYKKSNKLNEKKDLS